MDKILYKFGKRVAELRVKKKLTQEQLAELIGYSTNHISKLELARTNPSFSIIVRLAEALSVDIKELFDFGEGKNINYVEQINKKLQENPDRVEDIYLITKALL